ncbi:MAG: hypothetical protein J6P40_03420, partial [Oscillospiraceae bacterium]|nr:hypothetical protein [Oscillospiraceae bacterium]
MKEMTTEEMNPIAGGNQREAKAFVEHLMQKYNITEYKMVKVVSTPEEKKYFYYILNHKPGDPLKPYPDAGGESDLPNAG